MCTSPAVPGTIYVDGLPRDDLGTWTSTDAGTYRVCFGPVPRYATPDCQDVTVSAGVTTFVTGTYAPEPFSPAAVGAVSAEMISTNVARVLIAYALDVDNAGNWGATVYYLYHCTDASGRKLGLPSGEGGLSSWGELPISGQAGIVGYETPASIVSDEPVIVYPVTCERVVLYVALRNPDGTADFIGTTVPLLARTVWYEGVYIVHCGGACLGGW